MVEKVRKIKRNSTKVPVRLNYNETSSDGQNGQLSGLSGKMRYLIADSTDLGIH